MALALPCNLTQKIGKAKVCVEWSYCTVYKDGPEIFISQTKRAINLMTTTATVVVNLLAIFVKFNDHFIGYS